MSRGKVENYDSNRGVGIILDLETGQKHKVYGNYINLLEGEILTAGQEVEFDSEKSGMNIGQLM